jgi:hypothetical protein
MLKQRPSRQSQNPHHEWTNSTPNGDFNSRIGSDLRGARASSPTGGYGDRNLAASIDCFSPSRHTDAHGRLRNLDLVEHRVLRRLNQAGIRLTGREGQQKEGHRITEDVALTLGLLFRTLAPMRIRDNMRAVAEGIEAMGSEEAAYWLGMAMHRKNPRRVLTALRFLLTDPHR